MFDQNHIQQLIALDTITQNQSKFVSRTEYEEFCKEFVFQKLCDKKFGEAFCEKFGFNEFLLKLVSDETAKDMIETLGYIK